MYTGYYPYRGRKWNNKAFDQGRAGKKIKLVVFFGMLQFSFELQMIFRRNKLKFFSKLNNLVKKALLL